MKDFWKTLVKAAAFTVCLFAVAVGLAFLAELSKVACLAVVFLLVLVGAYVMFKDYNL